MEYAPFTFFLKKVTTPMAKLDDAIGNFVKGGVKKIASLFEPKKEKKRRKSREEVRQELYAIADAHFKVEITHPEQPEPQPEVVSNYRPVSKEEYATWSYNIRQWDEVRIKM